ncbi:MAG TPA: hypothetical protein IAC41_04590 [Candidatus Merdenecus merdavium]|nr:hypothetical protein [Candidatus Merdenecus merdavium]
MQANLMMTNWIWTPQWTFLDNENPQFVFFRKSCTFDGEQTINLKISADSRYKLYVNGNFIQEGPGKGNEQYCFYDEIDLSSYLKKGENTVAVIVLRYPSDLSRRNHSICRSEIPHLYIEEESSGKDKQLNGKSGWKCSLIRHIRLVGENARPAPLHILEHGSGCAKYAGWMENGFDDSNWKDAVPYTIFQINRATIPGNMVKNPLPAQRHIPGHLITTVCLREEENIVTDVNRLSGWNKMLAGEGVMVIPAHTKVHVEISAGELMTGYLKFVCQGGEQAKVTIHCAEAYSYPEQKKEGSQVPKKGDRIDFINGKLCGYEDIYLVGGWGNKERPEVYEPFWFRTFRFIGITLETKSEPLIIQNFTYTETGYPLQVMTNVETSDSSLQDIWDISLRSLKRCMHETYMDCPFYEQLQYAMDSRAEILFTYQVAADDRMARKCMEDFRISQRYDGMITCSAPSVRANVIPGFSIFYILMVYDHMMYFGDKGLVKTHMPSIDRILLYFEERIGKSGMPENLGGLYMRHSYWSFIDWTEEWNQTSGVPTAITRGPITMESLLYVMGLQNAAMLAEYIEKHETAQEYRMRAEKIKDIIREKCIGEEGLLQDGPGIDEYSVHCQVFGILTGVLDHQEGRSNLKRTINKEGYAQCSVAMSFYLFRALELTNLYEMANKIWDTWRNMLGQHLTTCVENTTDERSDCHGWGATALYELPAVTLGVRPASPGYEKVQIHPIPGYLDYAKGDVITPKGMVHVEWKKREDGEINVSCHLPEGMEEYR